MKSSRKKRSKTLRQLALGVALLSLAVAAAGLTSQQRDAAAPEHLRIVATLAPVHSLVAGVTLGVSEPYLLLKAGENPHHFSLKPRDAEAIHQADLLVAASLTQEHYLPPLMNSMNREIATVEMAFAEGATRLAASHRHGDHSHNNHADYDMHLWLDIGNAIALTKAVAEKLSELSPKHAVTYRTNAAVQVVKLEALDAEIAAAFPEGKRHAAYASFHEVLPYFEKRYGLTSGHIVAAAPEAGASVAEAEQIHKQAVDGKVECIFVETEFASKLMDDVAKRHPSLRRYVLDTTGAELAPSPELYFDMMRNIAGVISPCVN